MLLKDGIIVERVVEKDGKKDVEKSVLKEFEVLPATAMTAIKAVSQTDGDSAKIDANLIVQRIKIKDLPDNVWSIGVLSQMSVNDYVAMQNAINDFDKNFTFAPPTLRI
jgi:hypothetical protein